MLRGLHTEESEWKDLEKIPLRRGRCGKEQIGS
jgi:hypothetical protein